MRGYRLLVSLMLTGHVVSGEYSRIRLLLMRVFARYLELPLLRLSYLFCSGRYRFLSRFSITRWLLLYPIAYPFGHWGDTGRPVPAGKLVEMINGLEGKIAVGPCRCRIGHGACNHPMETDIVIKTGTEVWLEAFPGEYRVIEKEEATGIVEDCSRLGMFHMVFLHCLVGGAVNEYVICNCCSDGCVPFILNRALGQGVYPLVRGEWAADCDRELCEGCGTCVRVCPFEARSMILGKSEVSNCFGCGLCAPGCLSGATRMFRVGP